MTQVERYTCEEAFRRLDDYVDRELSDEEMGRVQEHLETCAVCAREFAFETSVLQHVRTKLHRIRAPATLRERLSRLLAEERDGPAR
jgi:mycothiol system anti-sigma-R factor